MNEINEKLTLIADNTRGLSGTEELLGLDEIGNELTGAVTEVNNQAEVINEIITALNDKVAAGSEETYQKGVEEGINIGKQEIIDNSSSILKTIVGTDIQLKDVSEIAHKIRLSAETNTTVEVYGDKFFENDTSKLAIITYVGSSGSKGSRVGYKITLPAGTYTFNASQLNVGVDEYIYGIINDKNENYIGTCHLIVGQSNRTPLTVTVNEGDIIYIYNDVNNLDINNSKKIFNQKEITLTSESTNSEYVFDENIIVDTNGAFVDSSFPRTNFLSEVPITIDYYASAGLQKAYDDFWDIYQNNGARTEYQHAFAGNGWTLDTFKPKYNMKANSPYMMFRGNTLAIDLAEFLEKRGITLDFSGCTGWVQYVFSNSAFTRLPRLDFSNVSNIQNIFENMTNLHTVDAFVVSEKLVYRTAEFGKSTNLINLTIEGIIGTTGFNISGATNLSKTSITSVINALSSTTNALTVTISQAAVKKAFETSVGANDGNTSAEWLALAGTKSNWTISLA